MLSARGRALGGADNPLVRAHARCQAAPYHPRLRPDGYINFGTAENHLLWDLLGPRLAGRAPLPEGGTHYAEMWGTQALRAALAAHLGRRAGAAVDPERLVVVAGASAALDLLAFALFDPGAGVLVPAPYYPGFDADLSARAAVQPIAVPGRSADGFALRPEDLAAALAAARGRGIAVQGLLLCHPHNPLGTFYGRAELAALLDFAAAEGLQCVVDEIYADSVYAGAENYCSALRLGRPGVHVVWGLAKDLALSGLKVGVAHPGTPAATEAMRALAYFAPVSTDTQALAAELLADRAWVGRLLAASRTRLATSAARVAAAVAAMGGRALPARAGLFAWLDLRPLLPAAASPGAAEEALRAALLEGARVSLAPGSQFHCPEPGFFRLCFAQPAATLEAGLARLAAACAPAAARRPA